MTRTRKKQTDQSVAWLTASLLELMDQQPLSKISVTAITNNAQLARRTFYRHFKSPQDLLTHEVDRFCSSFYHSLHSQAITTFPALVECFFAHCQEWRPLLDRLASNQLLGLVQERLLAQIDQSLLAEETFANQKAVYFFAVGGMGNLLHYWFQDGVRKTPAQMRRVSEEIVGHLLAVS